MEKELLVSELIPHPKNNEFFDDISNSKWEELVESIVVRVNAGKRGNIERILVTQNNVIVSGHQRVRAFKELNIPTIECDVINYESEDAIIQDLIEANIRQRGSIGGSSKKTGLRIKELERLYGIHQGNGSNQHEQKPNSSAIAISQSELAERLGMSVDTLQNYKILAEMIPELDELEQTGRIGKTTILNIMKTLSEEEQLELISSIPVTGKITQKQIESYVSEIKSQNEQLKKKLEEAQNAPTVIREIDKTDYAKIAELEKKIQNTQIECENTYRDFRNKVKEVQELRDKVSELEAEKTVNKEAKYIQESCFIFNARVRSFIKETGGYVWLAEEINKMPGVEQEGYLRSIEMIEEWVNAIKYNIEKQKGDRLV